MSSKRIYHQYCGLAAALDILGERWTLMIVRELLVRPRRYGELLNNLPGIGTNLLAERLKFLVDEGIVSQSEVDGSKRQAYHLTEAGEVLRPIVLGLARWGLDHLEDYSSEYSVRASWGLLAVEAMIDQSRVSVDEQYEFKIDDEMFHIDVRDGIVHVLAASAEKPAVTVKTDAVTFVQIGARKLSPLAATVTGKLSLEGDANAVLRACALLGLETDPVASAVG
jgi:DNA-binding HxlR family transcriptional regulator/putative sterol carrier protein